MAEKYGVYKCEKCGNIVQVLHAEKPPVMCCGKIMDRIVANTVDAAKEKHVPVVEELECCVKVKVGDVPHPMEEAHYIKFIEVLTADGVLRGELKPGQVPEAEFCVKKEDILEVREFCTVHMLWKS